MEWLSENWISVVTIGAALIDIVAGWLPDKWVRYPGIILSIANRMYGYGKESRQKSKNIKAKGVAGIGLIIFFVVTGCAGLPQYPACNAKLDQTSLLARIAAQHNVCVRDIGGALILTNAVAIGTDQYTVTEAAQVVQKWVNVLEAPILDTVFREMIYSDIGKFPGLFEVADIYMSGLTTGRLIDEYSRMTIKSWLEKSVLPPLIRAAGA